MKYDSVNWLIILRWIAASCVALATFFSTHILKIPLPEINLYGIVALLLLVNTFYFIIYRRKDDIYFPLLHTKENFILLQIVIDLVILTCLLHYSGGVENPFIVYYIFHLMIASILLTRSKRYFIATLTMVLVGIMALGEYMGILHHYPLTGFLSKGFYNDLGYLSGTGIIFVTTSYIIVYLTGTVTDKLKQKEWENQQANNELLRKDTIKNEYVYRITHDIKGHLGAIKNCLDVVIMTDSENQKKEFTERSRKRAVKLMSYIHDLLRITQLKLLGKIYMKNVPAREIIDEVIINVKKFAENKAISIVVDAGSENEVIKGDKELLVEAITNLVLNSISYSDKGSRVILKFYRRDENYRFEIEDKGMGIPESETRNILEEFFRGSNVKNEYDRGNGLGLAVVKQIIEYHNGKIEVVSKMNEGTRLSVILPV